VPFTLTGDVTGFAHDDLDATTPLFHVGLVGHGAARLSIATFDGALDEGELEYSLRQRRIRCRNRPRCCCSAPASGVWRSAVVAI
jgi:hypothetical protein